MKSFTELCRESDQKLARIDQKMKRIDKRMEKYGLSNTTPFTDLLAEKKIKDKNGFVIFLDDTANALQKANNSFDNIRSKEIADVVKKINNLAYDIAFDVK